MLHSYRIFSNRIDCYLLTTLRCRFFVKSCCFRTGVRSSFRLCAQQQKRISGLRLMGARTVYLASNLFRLKIKKSTSIRTGICLPSGLDPGQLRHILASVSYSQTLLRLQREKKRRILNYTLRKCLSHKIMTDNSMANEKLCFSQADNIQSNLAKNR